jgi:hypothetical protein
VIGEIDFHLTHIELASFTIGACNATFAAPEGVGVIVSDLSMALTLDWQLRFPFFLSMFKYYCTGRCRVDAIMFYARFSVHLIFFNYKSVNRSFFAPSRHVTGTKRRASRGCRLARAAPTLTLPAAR